MYTYTYQRGLTKDLSVRGVQKPTVMITIICKYYEYYNMIA